MNRKRITGIILCIGIIAISFCPLVYLNGKSRTFFSLYELKELYPQPLFYLMIGMFTLIPIVYIIRAIGYITDKNSRMVAMYFTMVVSVAMVVLTNVLIGFFDQIEMQGIHIVTVWFVVRFVLCLVDMINATKG